MFNFQSASRASKERLGRQIYNPQGQPIGQEVACRGAARRHATAAPEAAGCRWARSRCDHSCTRQPIQIQSDERRRAPDARARPTGHLRANLAPHLRIRESEMALIERSALDLYGPNVDLPISQILKWSDKFAQVAGTSNPQMVPLTALP
ncbi:hypothetical protein EVAR_14488_1 [Eumeta japonica]|uniref:Uncharacterized protein n=1 Tax=Eumeta variegata TaxID=151549 RepID=A0A4C1U365_EUMVA|nr:hypothetical protein EVAR_14488_1 [Eumeta japonica]